MQRESHRALNHRFGNRFGPEAAIAYTQRQHPRPTLH
jgi:hypothetical protein